MNSFEFLLPASGVIIGLVIAYQRHKTSDSKKVEAMDRVVRSANLLAVAVVAALVLLAALWVGAIYYSKANL